MRVETVVTSDNKTSYILLNGAGDPVESVLKYLKYKDNTGAARNTLRGNYTTEHDKCNKN